MLSPIDHGQFQLSADELERLRTAIGNLRQSQRTTLLMNRVERLSYAEISERLGIPVTKVERTISAALRALDREIFRVKRPWWRPW